MGGKVPGTGQVLATRQPRRAGRTTGRLHTQCDPSEQANSKESEASVLSEEDARPLTLCQVPRAQEGRPWAPGIGTGPVGAACLKAVSLSFGKRRAQRGQPGRVGKALPGVDQDRCRQLGSCSRLSRPSSRCPLEPGVRAAAGSGHGFRGSPNLVIPGLACPWRGHTVPC